MSLIPEGIATIVSLGIGWLVGKKKKEADLDKIRADTRLAEIERVEKIVNMWKDMVEELRKELMDVKAKCSDLAHQLEATRKENKQLKGELHKLSNTLKDNTETK